MAEPGAPQPAGVDKAKIKQFLAPAGALAAVIVLACLVVFVSGGDGRNMSDGSNGSTDDPDLKEVAPGVRYRDVKVGTGTPCPEGAEVTIHYTGWLTDGKVFDSSKERGQPTTFKLQNLIKGWQEGIPGMKPGGIRKIVISPDKGYGSRGSPPKIPGGSTLIFEVELIASAPSTSTTAGSGAMASGPGQSMPSDQSNGGTDDPGLKDIGDGLKIRDLKEGTGEPVKPGASVLAHYTGWTVDGKVFDSSHKRGKPMQFSLNGVVQGWSRGIPGMKPGGIRKLVIPAALGYGEQGYPPDIPGGATLIFEVEIVQ
ncbi:FKBP-type peptidyl-prolyl cis-trans isomerase [Frigoriglobus tundricola]|uniref:Peptidyl-prolyl cis-trans isomerase n=1 Tax=Frigoriglobus tundricola TaxID=2774151 RepID=A0A6M5YRH5_9BACT|nr:FKBP-type peptidyl-prolyl cis-trans isomerase [Frigoriglobus tundricola]QJW96034.1 Peptidylprolyl isomerase, FKBP-type [Frigoriglobus tundricola]